MSINVEGNNNRVAGRDYYESKIKPCPECELRLIEPPKRMCNHCFRIKQETALKAKLTMGAFAVICTTPLIHKWRGSPAGLEELVGSVAMTGGLLMIGAILIVGLLRS